MNILCVVKFVPDVDSFTYNYESHTISREESTMLINPDDASAVGFALQHKKNHPQTTVEVVTMAPLSIQPLLEDILRVGVDKATLIADPLFAGSDTYVTSKILSRYLSHVSYDVILTGTHAIDGDTSHVPSQIAQCLGLDHLNTITLIEEESFSSSKVRVEVEDESSITTYDLVLPAVLGLTREAPYRLPYVRYMNLKLDVSDRLAFVSHEDLGFTPEEVGLEGSRTQVKTTHTQVYETRDSVFADPDDSGVEVVYDFLKSKGFV